MKIRRYFGASENEALAKAKIELGEGISVLSVKRIRQKGIGGIMSQPLYELLVADRADSKSHGDSPMAAVVHGVLNDLPGVKAPPASSNETLDSLAAKVGRMEGLLERVISNIAQDNGIKPDVPNTAVQAYTGAAQLLYDNMVYNEVEPETARYIIDRALSGLHAGADSNSILAAVISEVTILLGIPEPINTEEGEKPRVVVFIGPTGVGKTTSLAKLAANYSLNSKKNVGLITADTYRIAAVDQLRTYSEIMGLPLSVAYSPQELKDAIIAYKDKDIIMIDTAGRSHRNQSQLEEIKLLVKASGASEIYLVMSVTTSIRNSREIIFNYSFLDDFKLLFTKADESTAVGIILNVRRITGKPLSYITNGQNVPDDIEVADTYRLANSLIEGTA